MEKYKLKNGITVIFEKNNSKSVALEIMFKVGSNYESKSLAGISHFLEHMVFEGTKKRKNSREISNEIEKYGGEFNAYTAGERTAFFIKIINKKFDTALGILSDMITNSVFDEKIIEKEKEVVLKEINMVNDELKLYQWVLFQKALFENHPAKNPAYGSAESVKKFNRKQILDYYCSNYAPNNMIVSIVGNATKVKEKIRRYFGALKPKKPVKRPDFNEPLQKKAKEFFEKKSALNSYMVIGYKTVPRISKDSYVLDVLTAILGRGQSGWLFDEIRNKRGLAYQVGVHNESELDYGIFAVYTNLDKSSIPKAKEIIFQQFKRIESISKKELDEAKTYIEGSYILDIEDNLHYADKLAIWESIKDANLAKDYLKNIRNVTVDDVKMVARKYLNDKYTLVVIGQAVDNKVSGKTIYPISKSSLCYLL